MMRVAFVCALFAALSVMSAPPAAEARTQYLVQFGRKYDNIKPLTIKAKCLVCHPNKDDHSIHNDYGHALIKHFGDETDVKPPAKIVEVLEKAEKEQSSEEGKTFGDLIKEGKLPGKNPEETPDA